tara:strand:+ start:2384 stop:2518 length:135 start_codon:yes stop_codon:yes gene_type:complete
VLDMKKIDKIANKRATQMARNFFNSGKSFNQFLKDGGFLKRGGK